MVARPEGEPGISVGGNYPGCGWFVWPDQGQKHRAAMSANGSLDGTSSYLMWRHDGVNWAVLFNASSGKDGKPLMRHFWDESAEVIGALAR